MNEAGDSLRVRFTRVESLVHTLEELPETSAREAARALTRALLDLHGAGLSRILELIGADTASRIADDPEVGGVLLLHGLHPLPADGRLSRALESLREQFHSLGGDVELVSATDQDVRLRLRGNPAVAHTLRALAEELVIEAAPDVETVEFEEAWDRDSTGRVPLPLLSVAKVEK